MKISYKWLKRYLPLPLDPVDVAELLTDVGLEVEAIETWESVPGGLRGLVIGEVLSVEAHPSANKLKLTQVNTGGVKPLQIICGAPNVAVGQKVVVALPGTTLHTSGGKVLKIEKANIRGVDSFGMICAEDEIGIGTSHDGIYVLPNDAPVGSAFREYYGVEEDTIFSLAVTPNRGDAMSHLGVARDLLAAVDARKDMQLQLTVPDISAFSPNQSIACIAVRIHNRLDCIRYCGLVIEGVTVRPSPSWLQSSLLRIGVKPVNNIVDVTNYVMWECGQPLHAFDADQLPANAIEIGNLPAGTPFETLDGTVLQLHAEDLMICSGGKGLCIAGVIGGRSSAISDHTQRVFLESATFRPQAVRRTSLRHQLRTDAAQHFEKGTDPQACLYALKRAALLIRELAGGSYSAPVDVHPEPIRQRSITLKWTHLNRIAGVSIPVEKAVRILHDLDFAILEHTKDHIVVQPPTAKTDVYQAQDVMEEVLRIAGLDTIPAAVRLNAALARQPVPKAYTLQRRLSAFLAANGFNEIINNSITSSAYARKLACLPEHSIVALLGSANTGLDALRTHLLFPGLEVIARNLNRQQGLLRFFEFGKVYQKVDGQPQESERLALWWCGAHMAESWLTTQRPVDFFDAKGLLTSLWQHLGLESISEEPFESELLVGMCWKGSRPIAVLGSVRHHILQNLDIDKAVWYADVDMEVLQSLWAQGAVRFAPLPRFPSVRRDLALILPEQVTFARLKQLAWQQGITALAEVNLFDVYTDERIGAGKTSYAVSFVFQPKDKTLTDPEVDAFMESLIRTFEQELHAVVRR
ncbi:MAG: phenylalanine--tRNA ligase subunit beta [Chitinophagales bacterium]|nr:phenylalanine--tRNA ligase subunit beta [Chitinophagales bacterium]MDW8427353.1 phenylalanine--tRNA ligase subunit beta [Chitinophagales bacterium]